mgnify:CR=1 FL=1
MTEQTKARAIEILSRPQCKWTIESATEEISRQEKVIEYWNEHSICWEAKYKIADAKNMVELLQAIISILMEREAEQEALESVSSCYGEVPFRLVRKIVAVMANKLRRAGISLSAAFKQAWGFVKFCVTHKHLIKRLTT